MIVDKKLSCVKEFQTLSRLNRTHTDTHYTYIIDILKTKYLVQQVIAINQQNIEFFIWVFGDTLAEIDSNTRTTLTIASNHGFSPKVVSVEKKEELLTQYYNFNDSLNVSLNQY